MERDESKIVEIFTDGACSGNQAAMGYYYDMGKKLKRYQDIVQILPTIEWN